MKRVNLKQEFHGEPDMEVEGIRVAGEGPDEVTIEITRGTLTLRVPSDTHDDQVLDKKFLDHYLQCVLELENGGELTIILSEDNDGVDVRWLTKAEIAREETTRSRLNA